MEELLNIKHLIPGLLCFVAAVAIFLFASGARRLYSGVFFVILGVTMIVNARRKAQNKDK